MRIPRGLLTPHTLLPQPGGVISFSRNGGCLLLVKPERRYSTQASLQRSLVPSGISGEPPGKGKEELRAPEVCIPNVPTSGCQTPFATLSQHFLLLLAQGVGSWNVTACLKALQKGETNLLELPFSETHRLKGIKRGPGVLGSLTLRPPAAALTILVGPAS